MSLAEKVLKEAPEHLQGHILEGKSRAVEELKHVVVANLRTRGARVRKEAVRKRTEPPKLAQSERTLTRGVTSFSLNAPQAVLMIFLKWAFGTSSSLMYLAKSSVDMSA